MGATKRVWIVRALVALVFVASIFAWTQMRVSADQNNYARFSNVVLDCAGNTGMVDFEYSFLAGSRLVGTVVMNTPEGEFTFVDEVEVAEDAAFQTIPVNVVPGGSVDVRLELVNPDGGLASTTEYFAACPTGEAWVSFTHATAGTPAPAAASAPVLEAVPGCDVRVGIPAGAVGGLFVQDAPVYWSPGNLVTPAVTIAAGNTALVLGTDDTGAYYQVLWGCQRLWVPVESMAPNPDAVYQGQVLPAILAG